jgi:hypothetical protein
VHPQLGINWELPLNGLKFKRIEQFASNLLLVEETGFQIQQCVWKESCEEMFNFTFEEDMKFTGLVEMAENIAFVDLLYVTKGGKGNQQYLNLVRLDREHPDTVLLQLEAFPVKNVKNIEVLRTEGPEEFFVQLANQNKIHALPLCYFNEYLHQGKTCMPCSHLHFNLDPQGSTCLPCT